MNISDITQFMHKNVTKETQCDILVAEKKLKACNFFKFLIKSYFPL